MKIENKILKYFYGECYNDKFYDEEREELREILSGYTLMKLKGAEER